jgi:exopolyphosphatase/guanosine-5'-triphosphate,3'-diphosphate pyrophosphatase
MKIDHIYREDLAIASKLYPIGNHIHFFSKNRHSYYLIKSALEYGFTHKQIMLIATLTRYAKNKLPSSKHIEKYQNLLPDTRTINYLSYLISVSAALLSHKPRNIDFELEFNNGVIKINSEESLYLSREAVGKLSEIEDLKTEF